MPNAPKIVLGTQGNAAETVGTQASEIDEVGGPRHAGWDAGGQSMRHGFIAVVDAHRIVLDDLLPAIAARVVDVMHVGKFSLTYVVYVFPYGARGIVKGDVGLGDPHGVDEVAEQRKRDLWGDVGLVAGFIVTTNLILIELDRDLLAALVALVRSSVALIEVAEKDIPGFGIRRPLAMTVLVDPRWLAGGD